MNEDIVKGNWKQLRGEAKKRWERLTQNDLDYVEGEKEKLEGRIQERYGYLKNEAKREVDRWYKELSQDK